MADDPEVESVVESIQRARSDIASQRSVLVAFHDLDVVVLEGIYLLKRKEIRVPHDTEQNEQS